MWHAPGLTSMHHSAYAVLRKEIGESTLSFEIPRSVCASVRQTYAHTHVQICVCVAMLLSRPRATVKFLHRKSIQQRNSEKTPVVYRCCGVPPLSPKFTRLPDDVSRSSGWEHHANGATDRCYEQIVGTRRCELMQL